MSLKYEPASEPQNTVSPTMNYQLLTINHKPKSLRSGAGRKQDALPQQRLEALAHTRIMLPNTMSMMFEVGLSLSPFSLSLSLARSVKLSLSLSLSHP